MTSPFVVVHAGAAWGDFHRVQELAQQGWLGFEDDPATPLAFGLRLWETIGPLRGRRGPRRRRRAAPSRAERPRPPLVRRCLRALAAPSEAHFDRYVLPLVPVLAVLAGRRKPLAVAALVACVVPLWWSVADARSLTGRDPRLDAAAWIDAGRAARRARRRRPVDAAPRGPDRRTARASGARPPLRPTPEPRRASRRRGSVARRRRERHRPRARGCRPSTRARPASTAQLERMRAAYATHEQPGRRERPWLKVYRVYP